MVACKTVSRRGPGEIDCRASDSRTKSRTGQAWANRAYSWHQPRLETLRLASSRDCQIPQR
eukprot:7143502-Pyramimonas_sp.AAC.1